MRNVYVLGYFKAVWFGRDMKVFRFKFRWRYLGMYKIIPDLPKFLLKCFITSLGL